MLEQLGVAVVRPQRGGIGGFFDVHVLEILGDEQRQVAVQPQRERHALIGRAATSAATSSRSVSMVSTCSGWSAPVRAEPAGSRASIAV